MKQSEIKALSTDELLEKLQTSEELLRRNKFANSISPIENPMQIRELRRLVARLKTEIHSRTIVEVDKKVSSGEINSFNARTVLSNTKFNSSVNLIMVKKAISKHSK